MPFTPAHIVAVLPVAAVTRRRVPFSALAIGSMVPDLSLFIPCGPDYLTTHSLRGVLTADLPMGLIFYLLFQGLMKRPLLALLPARIQRRCVGIALPCLRASVGFFAAVALAIVFGALTHIAWDSFTHHGRIGGELLPWIESPALMVSGHWLRWTKFFQLTESLAGVGLLSVLAVIWLRQQTPMPVPVCAQLAPPIQWAICLVGAAITAGISLPIWLKHGSRLDGRIYHSITCSGLTLLILALVYCLAFQAVAMKEQVLALRLRR